MTHRVDHIFSFTKHLQHSERFHIIEGGDLQKTLDFVMTDSWCKYLIACGSFLLMPEARGYFEPELLKIYLE